MACALVPLAAFAQHTAITRYARFTGNINFVATGGSLRTQSNAGDACAVSASGTQQLAGVPAGASIVAAYLYWGGSGAVADTNVTLNGQAVAAQRTFTATFNNDGTDFPYFGGFADITNRIAGNGSLTLSGLTVSTGAPHCGSSAVAAGWSVIAIYGSANERLRAVNVYDGLQFFRGNALTLNPDGFRIPPSNFDGRLGIVAWEGDPGNSTPLNGFGEVLRFNGAAVDDGIVVADSDPAIQPYDGTVNSRGVATSYGVDVDTFDVTALLAPGQTQATTQFSAGGDLVILAAQVVSATSEPVVDLSLTMTHTGSFTVGGTHSYTLVVSNAAGVQREDNPVVVTDTLPAGLSFVNGAGTGWTCGAAGQVVTCTHPPTLNAGASLPPLTLSVAASGAAVPSVTNSAVVTSASHDVSAANDTASNVTAVVGPDLSTSTKTVADLNGGEPDAGDIVRYTITLFESAGVAATQASVVDELAAELEQLAVVSLPPGAVDTSTGAGTGANGTGRLEVGNIAVPANGSVTVVFDARIRAGTPPATPIDNTAAVANPGGPAAAPSAPTLFVSPSAVPSSGAKPLYLRSAPAASLSRNPPGADAAVTVAFGTPVVWTLAPSLALPLTLPAGNIAVPLWLRRSNNAGAASRTIQLTLANTSTGTIGSATQTLSTLPAAGSPTLVNFVLPNGVARTFPAGSAFRLTVTQTAPNVAARSTLVYPVGTTAGNFSRVVLNSATVINVDSVQTFAAAYPGGAAQSSFDAGSTVYVRAVVSDPFGSFDIASAQVSILDPASVVRVAGAPLALVADSGAATRTYQYAYAVPSGAPAGGWSARVTGVEGTEGVVVHTRVGGFVVLPTLPALRVTKNVELLSDPVGGGANPRQIPGSLQRYRVNVTNTGAGAVDASTLVIADVVPANAALVVGSGGDPVQFVDGTTPSGLAFAYAANVTFSNRPGGAPPYDYVPVANASGVDPNVTALRVAPSGAMAGAASGSEPSFSVEFRVRVR